MKAIRCPSLLFGEATDRDPDKAEETQVTRRLNVHQHFR